MLFNKLESKLRRTANEVKKYRIKRQLAKTVCIACALIVCILYFISIIYYKNTQFNVSIKKSDNSDMSLALCEYSYSENLTTNLNFDSARSITNISKNMIPKDVYMFSGEHNGENYSAFSFYVRNISKQTAAYQYSVYINQKTRGIDEAIRLRLYIEDEYQDYAKISSDGVTPELDTIPFKDELVIVNETVTEFKAGDMTKFTVVIWLEGDDPECVNSIIEGIFSINFEISILDIHNENK